MVGLDPTIHLLVEAWILGSSPRMTLEGGAGAAPKSGLAADATQDKQTCGRLARPLLEMRRRPERAAVRSISKRHS
jgi:hypothetical protein